MILDALAERDWKPVDLARRMRPDAVQGSASSLSKYMRGLRQPDPATCLIIAAVLGEDPDHVLRLAGHRPHRSGGSSTRDAIYNLVDSLPEDALAPLLLMLRALQDRQTATSVKEERLVAGVSG
jgi:transcriptional regulator with XRE-family HTH domain